MNEIVNKTKREIKKVKKKIDKVSEFEMVWMRADGRKRIDYYKDVIERDF